MSKNACEAIFIIGLILLALSGNVVGVALLVICLVVKLIDCII